MSDTQTDTTQDLYAQWPQYYFYGKNVHHSKQITNDDYIQQCIPVNPRWWFQYKDLILEV